jgi:GTP-binding protein
LVGRSNAGKSSLINKLFETKLARVAKRQGTTKYMHFYGLSNNAGAIIDTPGYGILMLIKDLLT